MATEEKRILKMAYLLLQSNGYLKAGDLARELNLSERTIKNDIEHLRVFLKECGCTLDSVRGKGYILQIDEPDQFAKIREWLNILFNKGNRETEQIINIGTVIIFWNSRCHIVGQPDQKPGLKAVR